MPGKNAFARCVESVASRGGVDDPRAVCAKSIAGKRGRTRGRVNAKRAKKRGGGGSDSKQKAIEQVTTGFAKWIPGVAAVVGNKGKRKKNPQGRTPEQAFRDFHGREPKEIIEFETRQTFPRRTSGIGDLIELTIRVPKQRGGEPYVVLSDFGEAYLTENPKMKQLYTEGGDQSVDLEEFGLDARDPHEYEYLGELVRCVYHTRKDHLGRDGGTADYHHRFGKNELTLKKTELIKVGYHVPDSQLIFIGGGYEIPPEGIDG